MHLLGGASNLYWDNSAGKLGLPSISSSEFPFGVQYFIIRWWCEHLHWLWKWTRSLQLVWGQRKCPCGWVKIFSLETVKTPTGFYFWCNIKNINLTVINVTQDTYSLTGGVLELEKMVRVKRYQYILGSYCLVVCIYTPAHAWQKNKRCQIFKQKTSRRKNITVFPP